MDERWKKRLEDELSQVGNSNAIIKGPFAEAERLRRIAKPVINAIENFSADPDFDFDKKIEEEKKRAESREDAISGRLESHIANNSNPHNVTASQIGAASQEMLEKEASKSLERTNAIESKVIVITTGFESEKKDREESESNLKKAIEDEAAARQIEDELIRLDIAAAAVNTDWNEENEKSLAYLKNKPSPISDLEIDALFI